MEEPKNKKLNLFEDLSSKSMKEQEIVEDHVWIALAQKGDHGAFRKLVERYQNKAMAVAMGFLKNENDAKELVQETFFRAYKNLLSFHHGSSFFTWFYRIMNNLCIDGFRKFNALDQTVGHEELDRQTGLISIDFPKSSDPVQSLQRQEIAQKLQNALDELPEYHRTVIWMREVDGLSYEEMSEILGISKGTVMSRLFHARQKLQTSLAEYFTQTIGEIPTLTEEGKDIQ